MLLTHSCGAVDRFRVWLRKGSTLHEAFKPLKTAWIVQICTVYMDSNYRTIPELEGERIQTLPNRFEDLVELRWALLVLKVDQAICDFTKASTRQRGERAVQINSTPGRSARMHGTKTHKTPMSDCNKKNICFLIFDEHVDICCWYCTFWRSFYGHLSLRAAVQPDYHWEHMIIPQLGDGIFHPLSELTRLTSCPQVV